MTLTKAKSAESKKQQGMVQTAVQKKPELPEPAPEAVNGTTAKATMAAQLPTPPPQGTANRALQLRQLQGTVGNQRISRMMQPRIQTKLTVGAPNDVYEQEADRVADQVMRMPEPAADKASVQRKTTAPTLQRMCPECEEKLQRGQTDQLCPTCQQELQRQTAPPEEDTIQTKSENGQTPQVSPQIESYLNRSQGGGQPLPDSVRASMEPRFGQDFSNVRLHTDAEAAGASRELNAQAFTRGQDVYFGNGRYQPSTPQGQHLLAHELTHVVQQNGTNDSARSLQRSPNGEESGGFLGGLTSFGRSIAGGVGEVANLGRRGFASVVRRISPGLADLIERGPLTVLRELIERTARGWLSGIANRLNLGATITSIRTWLAGTFEEIESAASDNPKSCSTFAKLLGKLLKMARQVINHPAVQRLKASMKRANDLMADVASFFVETHIENIRLLWRGISGFANRVSGWIRRASAAVPGVLNWIAEQLGFSSTEGSAILDRLKDYANRAWQSIKEDVAPAIFRGFTQTARVLYEFSGLKAMNDLIKAGRSFMTAAQWLWENRNNPNLIRDAKDHPEIGQTILPRLLESAREFKGTIQSAFQWLVQKASSLAAGLLSLLGRITGLPILNMATSLLSRIKQAVEDFQQWAQEKLTLAAQVMSKAVSKIWKAIKPIISVISLLLLGAINPAMLPFTIGILLGSIAWKLLPDCYKPPIIDFLLDMMIEVLNAAPDVPMFGPLWSLLKPGLLAFLERIKSREPEEKIRVTNKLADIMLESGIDFVGGYVWGFLKGVWESLTDPFMLLWMLGQGLFSVVEWFGNIADRFFGNQRTTPAVAGPVPTAGTEALPADAETTEAQSNASQASPRSASASPGASGPDPLMRLQQMGEELRPPVTTVKDNFFTAAREYFSASGGATFDTLREKLGELWASAQETIATQASELADNVFNRLLGPDASEAGAETAFNIGEFIGWLTGTIVTEVVIAILSAGTVTAAKGAMKIAVAIAKVVDKVGDILGIALRLLRRLGRFISRIVRGVAKMVGGASRGALRLVSNALTEIMTKLRRFADELFGIFGGRAGREAAETGAGRGGRGIAPEVSGRPPGRASEAVPGTPSGRPRTQQDELLEHSATRELGELTPRQLDAELDVVFRSQRQPSRVSGYVDEVELPNGHIWRRRSDGRWCRFSNGGSCLIIDPRTGRPFGESAELSTKHWDDPEMTVEEFITDYRSRYPNSTLSDADLVARFDDGLRLNPETGRLARPTQAVDPTTNPRNLPTEGEAVDVWNAYTRRGDPNNLPCFPVGTLVKTPLGDRRIEEIVKGDQVMTYDFESQCVIIRPVMAVFKNWTQHITIITTSRDTLASTRGHPYWVESENKWIPAVELQAGMILRSINDELTIVISVETYAAEETTYNFEVADHHNYFVALSGILVHNGNFDLEIEVRPSNFENQATRFTEIYEVADVNTGRVVYVGQSVQGVDTRLLQHINDPQSALFVPEDNPLRGDPNFPNNTYTSRRIARGNWTPYEAAVWEQHYIDRHGGKSNLLNRQDAITPEKFDRYRNLHNPCL